MATKKQQKKEKIVYCYWVYDNSRFNHNNYFMLVEQRQATALHQMLNALTAAVNQSIPKNKHGIKLAYDWKIRKERL